MEISEKKGFIADHNIIMSLSLFVYCALCAACILEINSNPPYADARNYMEAAIGFRDNGFLSDFGSVRTYGYPFLLSLVSLLSGLSLTGLRLFSGLVQCAAYFGVAVWLASEVHKKDTTLSSAVLLGLSVNFFNIALLADTMTEAPSLVIALALTTICLRAARAKNARALLTWFAVGSILASFDLMIRPANIVVVAAWSVAGLALWWKAPKRTWLGGALVGSAAVIGASVLAPQIYYNFALFHRITPLPTEDLGNMQARFGIEMMKYATSLSDDGAGPVIYRNPLYDGTPLSDGAFCWYLSHPIAGIGTIVLHVFNSFNFDYPFVYIDDLNLRCSGAINFLSWFFLTIGAYHLLYNFKHFLRQHRYHQQSTACLLFLAALCVSIILLNSTVAVENRFNLVPTSVLIVSAVAFMICRAGIYRPHEDIVCSFAVAIALVALAGSEWAKGHSATIMQARQTPRVLFPEHLACGDTWDAAQRRPSRGFSPPEKDGAGPFRWTVAQTASIDINPCSEPAEIDVEIAFALTQDNISELQVTLAEQHINMTACPNAIGTLLRGRIEGINNHNEKSAELKISVPKLDIIAGTSRKFGVAVRSIAIHPDGSELEPSAMSRRCR